MGTLFSELAPHVERLAGPRIYADANVPAGIVAFMRERLNWDVLSSWSTPICAGPPTCTISASRGSCTGPW